MPPDSGHLWAQLVWLAVLALPIATVAWTVTHEELFRELHEYCVAQSRRRGAVIRRKFFYALTCEFCFSHYVTAFFVWLTGYHLLLDDWRGYLVAFFSLAAVANVYMSLFARVRVEIKSERLDIAVKEEAVGVSEKTHD